MSKPTTENRLWIGNQSEPDDRIQIVVSDADYKALDDQPRDTRRATVTDLLTGNRIIVQAADCGLNCKCALEIAGLAPVNAHSALVEAVTRALAIENSVTQGQERELREGYRELLETALAESTEQKD